MIRIIGCGKVREKWMKDGLDEYLKRLRPYTKIEVTEVADEKAPDSNSAAENEIVKKKEGQRLLKAIRDDEYVILLDLAGRTLSSEDMAHMIDRLQSASRRIAFVIGGSLGVSDELIARSDFRWKISDCTFPHQLCRVIAAEQIYRSFRILNHEPYHK
ncbi:MAG: 23S rRNA (pseudouridine(1915)-N(3))-methyltransferase RlmH [Solobacterium sp.]|nr:23S rRNA (pseudouridine(1915)-N(3))-methyltransferase RlmH [Solobacterium sp.]